MISHRGNEVTDLMAKPRANWGGTKLCFGRSDSQHKVGVPKRHTEGREAAPQGSKVDAVMMSLEEVGHTREAM